MQCMTEAFLDSSLHFELMLCDCRRVGFIPLFFTLRCSFLVGCLTQPQKLPSCTCKYHHGATGAVEFELLTSFLREIFDE